MVVVTVVRIVKVSDVEVDVNGLIVVVPSVIVVVVVTVVVIVIVVVPLVEVVR